MRNINNIELLQKFDTKDWIIWLKKLLNEDTIEPYVIFGDMTFDRKILWIKNEFEAKEYKTDKLSTAIFSLFAEVKTNKSNIEDIYYLIQLLAVFKNQEFAPELETIFLKGEFKDLYYNGVELNTSLLNALFNFKSLQDLSEYFHNILHENEKPIYYLLGLKFHCRTKEVYDYFQYLNLVSKKFITTQYAGQIGEGIVNSLNELSFLEKGRNEIFIWWTNNAEIFKEKDELFFITIRTKFSQWLNDRNKTVFNDLNLLNLKIYNDSLIKLDVEVFVEYANKIPKGENIEIDTFENCSLALGNFINYPKLNVWDMFKEKDIPFIDSDAGVKKFNRTAWVLQKTCSALARGLSNRSKLTKEQRTNYKQELISD